MLIPKYIRAKNILSFKELYYEFKQGTTTCIMGRNLTDSGQKSNGSGKSALQNAIELAYKGDFSRKINKAKIVRRGEKELEIESCSFNNIKNEFLFIHRVIPVKGSERILVYLFKDEQEFEQDRGKFKIDISSTNDANEWIIKYIGITKEDLGNYFFPNEITYKSFFDASDTQNKALISRFSNADIVDKAFINIQVELSKIGSILALKEKELLKLETTIENRQSDLTKEQERDFKKEQQDQIKAVHVEIKALKEDINNLQKDIIELIKRYGNTNWILEK
jgi:exonuclease SbcC